MNNKLTAGLDEISNVLIKKVPTKFKEVILKLINKTFEKTMVPTNWKKALITMIPKSEKRDDPKNYRPITCLPTLYKLLTSIISNKMYNHLLNE